MEKEPEEKAERWRKRTSVRLPIRKSAEGKAKGNRGNVLQKIKVKRKND